jgi:hypothetical protein
MTKSSIARTTTPERIACTLRVGACLAAFGVSLDAHATPGADAPAPDTAPDTAASGAPAAQDTVFLRDGNQVRGWIVRYLPGGHLIVQTSSASVVVGPTEVSSVAFASRGPESGTDVATRLIAESERAPGATSESSLEQAHRATPVAATRTLRTVTRRSWLDTKAGTLGRSTQGPDGASLTHQADLRSGELTRQEVSGDGRVRATTTLDARAGTASHSSSVDCDDSSGAGCARATKLSLGRGGLGAELSETRVTAVADPPKGFVVAGVDVGVLGITSESVNGVAAQAFAGVRGAVGEALPGKSGGGWSGLGLELQLGISVGQTELQLYTYSGTQVITADYQFGSLSTGAGWQYLHFGELDPVTLEQSGFGLFLGYRGGLNKDLLNSETEVSFSHGPQIAISFPRYNAGTADVSDFTIKGMILPTGDMTLFAATAGFGF